jgi:two-component system sensor histidine kinase HydH
MFRISEPESSPADQLPIWVVQAILLLAILACVASSGLSESAGWRFAADLAVAALLFLCVLSLSWLRRRYRFSQHSLRQVKMHAHDILASMDRGVVTTNPDGIITSINSAGLRLLGVDFECVGLPLQRISSAEVPLVDVFRQVSERDAAVLREGRLVRLRLGGGVLHDTQGKTLGYIIHVLDVTERMLMEERMRRMERFLGLANLAAGLHHEIKNPLTALSIHVQLLEENLGSPHFAASAAETVAVLRTEMCRLNGVLESFRSFANLQHLSIRRTDGLAVVEKAIRLIRPQAREQGVNISLLHSETELPAVGLDEEKFEQVVLNLLINALEAMTGGGELLLRVRVEEGEFRVDVKDTGPGIPGEVQRHLFQPYFSTKAKGTGMGLALSEKLISQHGGSIDYVTGSRGTTFRVAVPLTGAHEGSQP